ncbi:hypothetical protein Ccrd_022727 [Cynara cardunculus var. scolymus]|uniref:Uncharacterized protein n=1 Tax=Cynara cardunculus var. scolymus TaxID=59895 RepID=A0A103XY85_CYNCS|nr:hypothetical protein Ccrd_022727 [Cynara cardunculus var. scolymus]
MRQNVCLCNLCLVFGIVPSNHKLLNREIPGRPLLLYLVMYATALKIPFFCAIVFD